MKKNGILIIIIALIAIAAGAFAVIKMNDANIPSGGGSEVSGQEDPDSSGIDNGISFDEELEDAELSFKNASQEDFYGKWHATSGQSVYMYGNVDLSINEGGQWKGSVTEESLSGTWEYSSGSLLLSSELFNAKLSFTKDGKLIISIHVKVVYGVNIPAVVRALMHKVEFAVEDALQLPVSHVRVYVDEVVEP